VSAADAAAVSANEAGALLADLIGLRSVILAVSGGPDSTALLFLAARWRAARGRGPKLVAVTVDHGLRPGSAREAAAVKRLAGKLGVAHRTLRWTGPKPKTGIQEAARSHRYRLLVAAARKEGAGHILTAHTLDDQAETVAFRLVRGSGLAGLAGMARATSLEDRTLIRPLLGITKARLLATLSAAKIPFNVDPSNEDPRFARARLRRLLPQLAREGLDAARLATLARRLERAERALEWATDQAFTRLSLCSTASCGIALDRRGIAELPAEVALRLLRRGITAVGEGEPVALAKLETLLAAMLGPASEARNARVRRTLAGAMITADPDRIMIERAPPRRSRQGRAGVRAASRPVKASFTRRR
jgi:tRNA(Ile)-lysidine synthase